MCKRELTEAELAQVNGGVGGLQGGNTDTDMTPVENTCQKGIPGLNSGYNFNQYEFPVDQAHLFK